MILLVDNIPKINLPLAEVIKINCTYNAYKDIALFWVQDSDKAVISMLDGNMVIYNKNSDIDELKKFINVISPQSVFSDEKTLTKLFDKNFHTVHVMKTEAKIECDITSDQLNSNEIYNLLNTDGLQLPPYEHFAVDFCHRLNHGQLKYFAKKDSCVAIGISDGQAVLVNGIASYKKGMGSLSLNGLLSQYNLPCVAVCEKAVTPFYLKNNFSLYYKAGYWRKNP